MGWLFWAILSAVFAAATALLAKVGVQKIDSNLASLRSAYLQPAICGHPAHHGNALMHLFFHLAAGFQPETSGRPGPLTNRPGRPA